MAELDIILRSELAEQYDLRTCLQKRPAGGINPRLIYEMAAEIRAARPDVLHIRGLGNEGFHGVVAGRLAGCRRILLSVHGSVGDVVFPQSTLRQQIVSKVLEPLSLRLADGVYCVCEYAANRQTIVRHVRRHMGFIHNAIPHFSDVDPSLRQALRSQFDLVADEIVGITVARLTREKGLDTLCDALGHLHKTRQCPRMIIVGDGAHRAAIEERLLEVAPGKVIFTGQRSDVPALLNMSDFFVLPSLHENCSMAILEAMSCGLPVITTNTGGNPELVRDGENGLLVPVGAPQELAFAIDCLVGDAEIRARLGNAGRLRARTNFGIEQMVCKFDAIYRQLLEAIP